MKTKIEKSLKFLFIMIVIVALVSPTPVLAQDVEPTQEPVTITEVVTEMPTVVITEEPTDAVTEAPVVDSTIEPTLVPTEVATEILIVEETAPPVEEVVEPIAEIVETAADAEVTLVDENGDPIVMGSAESEELLTTNPDPWIVRGTITYRFLADCDPYWPDTATSICQESTTPIQNAINFANSGETVNLSGTFSNETVNISKSITLDGGGSTTIFAPSNTISGAADLSTGSENYYGLIYINKSSGSNITVNLQNLILDGDNITNSSYSSTNNAVGVLIGSNAIVNILNTSIISFARTGGSNPNSGLGIAQFSNNSQTLTINDSTVSNNNIGYLANSNSVVSGSNNNFADNTYWSLDFYHGRLTNSYWGINPDSLTYFGTARQDTNKKYFWYDFDGDHVNDDGEQVYYLFLDCPNNQYQTISGTPCTFYGTTFASIPPFYTGTYTSKYSKNNFDRFANAADLGDIEPYEVFPVLSELHCPEGMEPNEEGTACVPEKKMDICHSDSGYPVYTLNNVSVKSVLDITTCTLKSSGHGADPLDIIPPYTCGAGLTFAGQGDQTILANRCEVKGISITKTAAESDFDSTLDTLHYTYVITNTGNVTLTGQFTVTDNKINGGAAFNCGAAGTSIVVGGTVTCSASYPITLADLDAGSVTNTASGHLGSLASSPASVTVTGTKLPAITIVKSATETGYDDTLDTLHYTYVITNTGNVTLSGQFTVTDNKINGGAAFNCGAAGTTLAPNVGNVTCTSSYPITLADLDAGSVTNTASGHLGSLASSPVSVTVTGTKLPALTIDKTVTETGYDSTSDTLHYSYLITNTGNVTLTGQFRVTDTKINGGAAFNCGAAGTTLAPNVGNVTCTASYPITLADLDAGAVTNVAYASLGTVNSPTDTVTVTGTKLPALAIKKTAAEIDFDSTSDTLHYTYTITNIGNVTLTGQFTVTDNKINGGAAFNCGTASTSLAPLETVSCSSSYAITQPDLNAGFVTNTANAHFGTVVSDPDSVTVRGSQKQDISITKTAAEEAFDSTEDTLHYTYVITNTGNVTLTGQFTVTDNKINGGTAFNCGTAGISLAPGEAVSCSASYTITQDDLDEGSVVNTARGHLGELASGPMSVTVGAIQNRTFSVDKTIESAGPFVSGSTILYSIIITNTGNVTLEDVTLSDPNATLGTCLPALPVDSLAPGASITCPAVHVVLPADITAGLSYVNTATATSGKISVDGSVTATLDILGCMDPTALNFNASATLSDASCTYPIPLIPVTGVPTIGIPVTGGVGGLIPVTGGTLIVSGLGHSCMTYNDGQVICWGLNASGQLGDGTTTNRLTPVYVKDLDNVLNLTAGSKHTCALSIDGEVWCWGENSSGQLGNGKTTDSTEPVLVTGLPDEVLGFTAGENFTCAQLKNQEVWCWGENGEGQLNDGTTTDQTSPVKSQLTTLFAQISGGQDLLLGSDVLGNVDQWAMVQSADVQELTNTLSISANRWGTTGCAATADGTVKCWGSDLKSILVPETLPAIEVSAGLAHNCAINNDESVSCWGENSNGELGNGTNTDSENATLVKNLELAHALAVGAHHTCVLTGTQNIALCWGENNYGQLGNDSTVNSNLPVFVVMPTAQ